MILIILLLATLAIAIYVSLHSTYFYSTDDYPQLKILEHHWQQIAAEIPSFDVTKVKIKRERDEWNNDKMAEFAQRIARDPYWFKSWDNTNVWYSYPLMFRNKTVGNAAEMCPETIRLLKRLDNVRTAGYSLLVPYGELEKHVDETGPTYNSMAMNMNLTGNNCSLFVKKRDGHFAKHIHKKGAAVIFNSELLHYAKNDADENRIILYVDFNTA